MLRTAAYMVVLGLGRLLRPHIIISVQVDLILFKRRHINCKGYQVVLRHARIVVTFKRRPMVLNKNKVLLRFVLHKLISLYY